MKEEFKDELVDLCFNIWVDISSGDKLISDIRKESREKLDGIISRLPEKYHIFSKELYTLIDYIIAERTGLLFNESRN